MTKYLNLTRQLNSYFSRVNKLTDKESEEESTFFHVERIARKKSAEYIWEHMAPNGLFNNEQDYWDELLKKIPARGLIFEFGVYKGRSINYLAEQLNKKGDRRRIYGFDSFLGMTDRISKYGAHKDKFDLKGIKPVVLPNVNLIKGFVEETFATFMDNLKLKDKSIAFMRIDLGLYQPTKHILEQSLPYLKKGTIIDFDELLGYADWQENEYKAMMETIGRYCDFEHIAYCEPEGAKEVKAGIKITRLYPTHR